MSYLWNTEGFMILYFTGTGNSRYVADRINKTIDDECIDLFDRLKSNDTSEIHSERPFVIVAPTYGWQLPRLVRDWLIKTKLTGNKDIYFALTCGDNICNAGKYLKELCDNINMNYKGVAEIIMPENYIALFNAPNTEQSLAIIDKADDVIERTAKTIAENMQIADRKVNIIDKFNSCIVNKAFYPLIVHAKKFYTTDACIGCGECVNACVLNNIKLVDYKPKWSDNCTHCMACICGCPTEAIEYGKASKGKPRYICPKTTNFKL